MNKLSFVSLAAIAACSGAPVIQQSAPTAPEADPKTKAEVATALETAKLIRDKCISLLPDGGTSFRTVEIGEKVITTLEIIKGSQNGDTITKETCKCIYTIDIPTFVHEKTSCKYSYDTEDEKLETEYAETNTVAHAKKPNGRRIANLYTTTRQKDKDREPYRTKSIFTTEISADGGGCKTSNDIKMTKVSFLDDWTKIPYDPTKLGSCEYFADEVCIFAGEVRDAICEQLKQQGVDNPPPLCAGGRVYHAPATGTGDK